jgi:hypothetical protein
VRNDTSVANLTAPKSWMSAKPSFNYGSGNGITFCLWSQIRSYSDEGRR